MRKGLYILFAAMFIVMSGYGLTLTVLPFYIERMALKGGATPEEISIHVGAITGVFALMQVFFFGCHLFMMGGHGYEGHDDPKNKGKHHGHH